MGMSLADVKTEIHQKYAACDEIWRKYDDGLITNNEDAAQYKKLESELQELETRREQMEEGERKREQVRNGLSRFQQGGGHTHPTAPVASRDERSMGLGELFTDSSEYRRLLEEGQFKNNRNIVQFTVPLGKTRLLERAQMQRKALVTTGSASGGAMIFPDIRPGIQPDLFRERTILDLVPTAQTDSDVVEYVQVASFTNNAAVVAEASATTGTSGLKPESALTTRVVSAPVVTVAHWVPVTNKMLADAPAIRGIIDQHLLIGLELALEDQVLAGNGTGDNMTGILNSGIQVQAKGSDNALDAIFKALTKVRVTGLVRPTAIAVHPTDFSAIRLARENNASATYGGYLMGPPSQAGEVTLWGMPVYESLALTQGTAVVGAWNLGGMLFEREGSQIRVGLINDQFVRNMQTILAEARAVWTTFRPSAFCQVTGL